MNGIARVAVGCAADENGNGIAYARLGERRIVRVGFSVRRRPALLGREIAYAALTAICAALRHRGIRRLELAVDDDRLAGDLRERGDLPEALTMAYVRLRCALNQFTECSVGGAAPGDLDLGERARSDLSMHAAA